MAMPRFRRLLPVLLAVMAAGLASCERLSVGPELAAELGAGRSFAAQLAQQGRDADSPADVSDSTVVALTYLERLRLGLGSPFRLIELARSDPRLSDSLRTRLGWALLASTLDGRSYDIDPAVFLHAGRADSALADAAARAHLALVERTVSRADDPRAGELTVRLAYTLAAAEHSTGHGAPLIAARVAALVRDRRLAHDDALALLKAARAEGRDPLALITAWRAGRQFQVERSPMDPLPSDLQRHAMTDAPRVLADIRQLTAADSGSASQVYAAASEVVEGDAGAPAPTPVDSAADLRADGHAGASLNAATDAASDAAADAPREGEHAGPRPLLARAAAVRAAAVAARFHAPPQAPIVVAIASYRGSLRGNDHLSFPRRAARERFAALARNEESFAAEFDVLDAESDGAGEIPALTALSAAVAMRAYAQEEVWLPGWPGPSDKDLHDRFGLAAVTFDANVPASWRPYYRRMIASALADMQRVIPSLTVAGLHIHVGDSPLKDAALAFHDPNTRTLFLPVGTGAGTIAHEVAHDLDWQVARTRYGTRAQYATDRAILDAKGPLAASLRGLTAAVLIPPLPENNYSPPHAQRPAEVFARSVDWLVAVSLAREGRTNGYLSSVQDDMLTGYVTVTPPDISGEAGRSLVRILDDVSPVDDSMREWFLTRYGIGRALTPYDLVRRVSEASVPLDGWGRVVSPTRLLAAVRAARDSGLATIRTEACRAGATDGDHESAATRRDLVLLAAQSRAHGIVRGAARWVNVSDARAVARLRRVLGVIWPVDEDGMLTARLASRRAALDDALDDLRGEDQRLRHAAWRCDDAQGVQAAVSASGTPRAIPQPNL